LVEHAYRSAAGVLVELRALADRCGETFGLGDEIMRASQANKLNVAPLAALIVLDVADDVGRSWRSWKHDGHEAKLTGKIPMLVQRTPGQLTYPGSP
jgi:hypothetical protein